MTGQDTEVLKMRSCKVMLRIPSDVMFRDLAGEAVILNLTTGIYFGLDSMGTRMWSLIAEHGTVEKVVEALLAEYDVEEGTLRQDCERLIQELIDKGLVTSEPS